MRYRIVTSRERGAFEPPRPIEYVTTATRARDDLGRRVIRQVSRETRDNGTVSVWRFDYADTAPTTKCLNFSRSVLDSKETEIFNEYATFEDLFYKFPENIAHPLSLPFLMTGANWSRKTPVEVYSWAQDGKPTHLFYEIMGEEKIVVPLGSFNARKIRIRVDKKEVIEPWGKVGNIIANLIPDFYFWYSAEPPHRLVKMKMELSPTTTPAGAPLYYQELIEISAPH